MIRSPLSALCLTFMLPSPSWAASCEDAMTTAEMRVCTAEALARADSRLNTAYRDARVAAREADRLHSEVPGNGAEYHLREAQRAWIKLRDADCALAGFPFRGGTMEPVLVTSCLADLTEKRTEDLKDLAQTLRF